MRTTRTRTEQAMIGYHKLQPVKMKILIYADDIVLIADSEGKYQRLMEIQGIPD